MTIVMQQTVSKSQLKSQLLEFLRDVEDKKQPLIVTHNGQPVVEIVPIKKKKKRHNPLKGTVLKYEDPFEPVGLEDWEALK